MARRHDYLEALARKGTRPKFYDPDGERYGIPTYPYHYAADGLMTRRQLRAADLAPGGHDPVAQILWNHHGGVRVAWLYDSSLAVPKRNPTEAQLEAVGKALTARKTCPSCETVQDYCIPTSLGECVDCADGARRQADPGREAA